MHRLDICVVTYRPQRELIGELLKSLAEQPLEPGTATLKLLDNSPSAGSLAELQEWCAQYLPESWQSQVTVERAAENLGFGRGINFLAQQGIAPYILALNPDVVLEPEALSGMLAFAVSDESTVAAWEFRQIPYEHPKAYDPASLDALWVSGAAVLFRRQAFVSVGGFDRHIFMYAEDVDLSWRLRAAGWRLRYVPRFAVVHHTYAYPAEVKRMQVLGGTLSNLCLRARFGSWRDILLGMAMIVGEITLPHQDFPGRRSGLFANLFRFAVKLPYFRSTRVRPTSAFVPIFNGWGFEYRRDGAFHSFRSRRELGVKDLPLVSILIRTVGRQAWLRQALLSVMHQIYPEIEVIVVEDGPPASQEMIEREFSPRLRVKYLCTQQKVGRARAGNIALANASGEWLNFLDDDDLLFADHVEVLVDAVRGGGIGGAYALSWETHTRVIDRETATYVETMHLTRHNQPFDRITLWHHNYLPIQAVLFHRRLFEQKGGFAEDMDQLEDWNLWTRYTLDCEFRLVPKTTSKYRVPAELKDSAMRQAALDEAYSAALAKQEAMEIRSNPRAISEMVEMYLRGQSVLMITRNDVRRWFTLNGAFGRLAKYRHAFSRRLRRETRA